MTTTKTTETTTYYRTGKGKKRHASSYCGNVRRSIFTGELIVIPAGEVKDWAPCKFCCAAEEVAAFEQGSAAPAEVAKEAYCANTGVRNPNPRKLYNHCSDCGKEGAVNPKTGTLRAHKPAK